MVKDEDKIADWNKDHAYREESLFTKRLLNKGLNSSQIVSVLDTIDEICLHCWDSDRDCQCWNDE